MLQSSALSPLHPDIIPAVIKAARNNANGFTFFIDRIVPFSIFSRLNQGIPIQFKWFLNYFNKRQSPVIQRSGGGLYHSLFVTASLRPHKCFCAAASLRIVCLPSYLNFTSLFYCHCNQCATYQQKYKGDRQCTLNTGMRRRILFIIVIAACIVVIA